MQGFDGIWNEIGRYALQFRVDLHRLEVIGAGGELAEPSECEQGTLEIFVFFFGVGKPSFRP